MFLGHTSKGDLYRHQGWVNVGPSALSGNMGSSTMQGRHEYTLDGAPISDEEAQELLGELDDGPEGKAG